jgi:hypothetical protein
VQVENTDTDTCGSDCISTGLYVNETKISYYLGRCVPNSNCGLITAADLVKNPCGELCVKDENDICSFGCTNILHYEVNNNGVCVLITPCEKRTVDEDSVLLCGEDCVENENSLSCSESCENNNHYENNTKGKCVFKSCTERTVNTSSNLLCGDECYARSETMDEECYLKCQEYVIYIYILILYIIYHIYFLFF